MNEWQDQGIILSTRRHGENGAVVTLLTEQHGRHAGYVYGATSRQNRGMLEPGSHVSANWKSRDDDGLGHFSLELEKGYMVAVMDDPARLAAMISACDLVGRALPERERHAAVFHGLLALLQAFEGDLWEAVYVWWEVAFLRELGFALDLESCAATGVTEDLVYVSPRSGRAVSRAAGEIYKEKLLPLPAFICGSGGVPGADDIRQGLELTGYFLRHKVFYSANADLPESRTAFAGCYDLVAPKTMTGVS